MKKSVSHSGSGHSHQDHHAHILEDHFAGENNPAHEAMTPDSRILTIRPYSGLSGDMVLTGLATLAMAERQLLPDSEEGDQWLAKHLEQILPQLKDTVRIGPKLVNGIAGWHSHVELPLVHEHRSLTDIKGIIEISAMPDAAKARANKCFELLADCEARVHGKKPEEVHFHEVGALDSILDICGACLFYEILKKPPVICGPLPIADGAVICQHGLLPAPPPAVLGLLKGLAIRPFSALGETVTPTAASLLHILEVNFGPWPAMVVQNTALVYGGKVFPDVPNGAAFALGSGPAGIPRV